jgi:hypothetical protein
MLFWLILFSIQHNRRGVSYLLLLLLLLEGQRIRSESNLPFKIEREERRVLSDNRVFRK